MPTRRERMHGPLLCFVAINNRVLKVWHFCSWDMEIEYYFLKILPAGRSLVWGNSNRAIHFLCSGEVCSTAALQHCSTDPWWITLFPLLPIIPGFCPLAISALVWPPRNTNSGRYSRWHLQLQNISWKCAKNIAEINIMWTKSYSVDVKRCAHAGLLSISVYW